MQDPVVFSRLNILKYLRSRPYPEFEVSISGAQAYFLSNREVFAISGVSARYLFLLGFLKEGLYFYTDKNGKENDRRKEVQVIYFDGSSFLHLIRTNAGSSPSAVAVH